MSSGVFSWWVIPAVVAGTFAVMSLAEAVAPLRRRVESQLRRLGRNLTAGATSFLVVALLQTPLLVPFSAFVHGRGIGLLHWIDLPRPWAIVVAVLLLDYTLWIWHWANHRVPFLWRFHLAHHVDLDMDASTALRFHYGEMLLSIPVRALQIALIGADPFAVAIWQLLVMVAILFHHSNTRLPRRFEAALARIVVTPRFHGIHHSARIGETNSNWGTLLTLWDFVHRTFRFDVPDDRIVIGVPAYQNPRDVTIGRFLTMPFRKQRDDWG
jgi:sterol desaturase/sphingolipid hydroxylase (fatty acid hydroxylase superfamily)